MASSWVGLIAFVVAAAAIVQGTGAATHIVGGSTEWTFPIPDAALYDTWAKNQTFADNDVLSFVFDTSRHDVAKVTKADFDVCSTTATKYTTSPYNFTLTAGEHYFFCTFGNGAHCNGGQKLAITVGSTPAGSPGSSPTPTTSAPPPPSSASSLGAGFGGFVAVLTAFFL